MFLLSPDFIKMAFQELVDFYCEKTLTFLRTRSKTGIPIVASTMVVSLLFMLDSILTPEVLAGENTEEVQYNTIVVQDKSLFRLTWEMTSQHPQASKAPPTYNVQAKCGINTFPFQ